MPKYRTEPESIGAVIQEIPIDRIDPFPDHPFKVKDDASMAELIESIRVRGLLTPVLVRKQYHGRFELISGHRRLFACKALGMTSIRCEVVELTKEEAVIAMVESNFHRPEILPSEKAFAYKMRLEAMKMQISRLRESERKGWAVNGRPAGEQIQTAGENIMRSYGLSEDEVEKIGTAASRRHEHGEPGGPVGHPVKSRDIVAKEAGESVTQIRRYIRLTELIPELLDLVDEKKIGLRTAVELSYLGIRQRDVYECIMQEQCFPTQSQAIRMKKLYQENKLTREEVEEILFEDKPNQQERIVLHGERFIKMMPSHLHRQEYEEYIAAAIEHYARYQREELRKKYGF